MDIEEGDTVVTPDNGIGEVDTMIRDGKSVRVKVPNIGFQTDLIDDLVRVDEPIRVRVDSEHEAEMLVGMAEDAGFELAGSVWSDTIKIVPSEMTFFGIARSWETDLNYENDYKQIKAWLQFHAESEDDDNYYYYECPRCRTKAHYSERKLAECTNCNVRLTLVQSPDCTETDCTDSDDEYDEPRPEDEEWREKLYRHCYEKYYVGVEPEYTGKELGFGGKILEMEHLELLVDHINDLEETNEELREERDRYKEGYSRLLDIRSEMGEDINSLKERIEEARERNQRLWGFCLNYDPTEHNIGTFAEKIKAFSCQIKEILSPDEDGDSCD